MNHNTTSRRTLVIAALALGAGHAVADAPPAAEPLDTLVNRVIADFQPPARSRSGELRGESPEDEAPATAERPRRPSRAARTARSIWPDGDLPPQRAGWFCDMFKRISITNASLVYFDVTADVTDDKVTLRGATNAPRVVDGLIDALQALGISAVTSEVRTLPDRERLGERIFGACIVRAQLTRTQPGDSAPLQTQLLFGEPVHLLDARDEHYLLLAGDGYWGWAPESVIFSMNEAAFREYTNRPVAVLVHEVNTDVASVLRGARLFLEKITDSHVTAHLPDCQAIKLPQSSVLVDPEKQVAEDRVRAAVDLLRVPYVFGGRGPEGLDCSGLMTNIAARAGDAHARDAWQQAFAGTLSATSWQRDGMRAGDQVFFIDPAGKLYHTGVAISNTHILHAAPPSVQIGTFVKGDRLYDARIDRDFFMAKRP